MGTKSTPFGAFLALGGVVVQTLPYGSNVCVLTVVGKGRGARQTDRQTEAQERERQTDRQTDRDRQTETEREVCFFNNMIPCGDIKCHKCQM